MESNELGGSTVMTALPQVSWMTIPPTSTLIPPIVRRISSGAPADSRSYDGFEQAFPEKLGGHKGNRQDFAGAREMASKGQI
ncbi:uncharacterized protein PAC_01987 [Phialocephala subalpina]|uniref:Uncharacterized protein n=1 Tax=Phialocephala subalpina TaxID=576137 RepID=A0A1L7WH57_9HELO|nr:uncharacterized protein PAC_01987 [Phialocephala subalpina]